MSRQPFNPSQTGTALVIALVMLAAITLLAVAAVQTSVMEMRMANSDEMRMQSFQGADSAVDFVIRDFATYQRILGNANTVCVNKTGDSTCAGGNLIESEPIYETADLLTVNLTKLGECLPPPRIKSGSSVKEFTRFDYVIDSELDRTAQGGGKTHLWRGYMQISPSGGC